MSDQLDVYIPGYLFARLLNCAAKSNGIESGLLFGEVNTQVVCAISDSQHGTMQKREISIQELHINDTENTIHNHLGVLNKKCLEKIVIMKRKNIIGWFSIRRNTNTSISLKERTVLDNLLDSRLISSNKLIFLLLTPTYEDNKATYNFLYKGYLCEKNTPPISKKLNVINLGGGEHEHEYLHKSRLLGTKQKPTASFMKELQETQAHKFVTETGSVSIVDNTHSLFEKVLQCMKKVQTELSESNAEIKDLEMECKNLEELIENNSD